MHYNDDFQHHFLEQEVMTFLNKEWLLYFCWRTDGINLIGKKLVSGPYPLMAIRFPPKWFPVCDKIKIVQKQGLKLRCIRPITKRGRGKLFGLITDQNWQLAIQYWKKNHPKPSCGMLDWPVPFAFSLYNQDGCHLWRPFSRTGKSFVYTPWEGKTSQEVDLYSFYKATGANRYYK